MPETLLRVSFRKAGKEGFGEGEMTHRLAPKTRAVDMVNRQ